MPTLELISLILNFALGSGMIGLLIFYRSKRRAICRVSPSRERRPQTENRLLTN